MTNKYKSSAQIIPVDSACGTVLAHDITEIRAGQFKGPSFRKGHVVGQEDIAHLKRLGKEHLFVLKIDEGEVHEDDAALMLAKALSGTGVIFNGRPEEGKIGLKAEHRGLLKVDIKALTRLCLIPEICCAARHNNVVVEKGDTVAATRAIPLVIDETILDDAVKTAQSCGGIFSVKPFDALKAGLIITGNEVFSGLIEDKFAPILKKKLSFFGCEIERPLFSPDDRSLISTHIKTLLTAGAQIILVAGGMSVDPDDVSRLAIADAGAEDIVYGTSVLPGAMFLYGRIGKVPVLGVPACALYYKATVLDLILPRVLAGEMITRQDLAELAHGGLCLNCETCRYPRCPFGK